MVKVYFAPVLGFVVGHKNWSKHLSYNLKIFITKNLHKLENEILKFLLHSSAIIRLAMTGNV